MQPSAPTSGEVPPGRHQPLRERKRLARQAARRRIRASVRRPLSAQQRAHDPLVHRGRTPGAKILKALLAFLGSLGVHGLVVLAGFLAGTIGPGRREEVRQEVTVEIREREPLPPPPPPPETPPPAVVEKPVRPPPVAKAPPPPAEKPKGPPPRVVGLSLESTAEGGGGPSFAVGNTRAGETAARATDPQALPPAGSEAPPTDQPAQVNRAASRLPSAGVAYTMPKPRGDRRPRYPEALKAQGIEGDVPVLVQVDATGKVTSVKILKETPYPDMNEAARRSALEAEYDPATRDGLPIPYALSYTIKFRLEEQ